MGTPIPTQRKANVAHMVAAPKGRKNPRAQVALVARYRSPTAFEFVQEECCDLSAGGMFIKSASPAPAGTLIKLECDVDHGAQTIRGVARVVWLREQEVEGQPRGMGIKFVKLEAGGREALQAVLAQLGVSDSDPPDAALRRSSIPSNERSSLPTRTSEGMSPVPREAAAPAKDSRAAPVLAEAPKPSAARPAPPRPVPPSAPAAPAKGPEETTGLRTLAYFGALALAAAVVYAMQGMQQRPAKSPKLATAPQAEPAATPEPAPEPEPATPKPSAPAANEQAVANVAVQPAPVPTPSYVLEVATTPEGARVTAGEHTLVAPGTLELGMLTEPVELRAEKPGYQPASAVVDRVGFMLDEGQMRRRIALTLVEEPKPEPVAKQAAPKEPKAPPRKLRPTEDKAKTQEEEPPAAAAPVPSEVEKPAEPKPEVVQAEPQPTPEAIPEQKPEAAAPLPAPVAVEAPVPRAEPRSAPKPAKPAATTPAKAPKVAPLQAAEACLATGDNACVVKALEGKAKSAKEIELLIETYRALGDTGKAEKQMQVYVSKYPTERHASGYRRVLERRQTETPSAP